MIRRISILVLIFIFSININVLADENQHFKSMAISTKASVKKGEKFKILYTITTEESWYIYSLNEQIGPEGIGPNQTEITVGPEGSIKLDGKINSPKPKVKYDKGFEMDVESYSGSAVFEISVLAEKDISFDSDIIDVILYVQQCTIEKCLPPLEFKEKVVYNEEAEVSVSSVVKDESQDSESESENNDQDDEIVSDQEVIETESSTDGGIFSFLWIAIAAGAASLLTPCVFPMVPITVSFFTKRAEQTKGKGLRDALVYAFGIVVTFTTLGFVFSMLFGATGILEFAKNPWVYLFIAGIFIFFTLNLFGAFEIQMPSSMINKLDAKSRTGSGITSVILMALTFSLASFSCTGPLIGSALISASGGEWFYPIISMLAFSATLAAPFFLLALFPTAIKALPKAGGWMNNVKVVLGFIVISTSLYFINNAFVQWDIGFLSRDLFLSILIGINLLTTLYVLGLFQLPSDTPVEKVGVVRLLFAMAFASFTIYLVTGLFGKPLGEIETFLPQSDNSGFVMGGNSIESQDVWMTDYDAAVEEAKKQNKSLFIDFTGKACTNCKKMEKLMFPKKNIKELLSQMILVKLVTDVRKEPYISNREIQLKKFKSIEIPLYVVQTPDEDIIGSMGYTNSEDEFKDFLQKGINP